MLNSTKEERREIMNVKKMLIVALFLIFCLIACVLNNENVPESMQDVPSPPSDSNNSQNVEIPTDLRPMEDDGEGKGFFVDENGQILFSMKIDELDTWLDGAEKLSDYRVRMRFIVRDTTGHEYFAYSPLTLPIDAQNEKEFEVLLQGEDADSGFCPTAMRSYNVEVTVIRAGKEVLCGWWKYMHVPSDLAQSAYYRPTAIPTEEQRSANHYTVQYLAKDGGRIEGDSEQTLNCGKRTSAVTAIAEPGYLFWCWSDGVKTETRQGDVVLYDKQIYALFTKDELDAGIPNLYIDTEHRRDILSKVQYVAATVTIKGAANDKFNVHSLGASIRCRGNSSYSSSAALSAYNSKNSYRLKLDEKANLLGVGNSVNRDWVLHSNKFDASNLRNYFVWNLANQMASLSFVPSCTWVNLYVNGDYRGIYMISEQIEVANNRIEIDDSGTDPDKGYLVELDMRGQQENGVVEGLDYFYLPGFYDKGIANLREWVIKSEITSKAETTFIRNYFIRCHNAIMKGNQGEIDALVDIDSLVDMFILQELSKDVDGGGASIYWQKEKAGKLSFTAPWDYDFGFGSYGVAVKTENFVCETENGGNKPNLWLQSLLKQEWFLKRLHVRMQEADEMIQLAKRAIRMQAEILTPAADRNDRKWDIYGRHFQVYLHVQVTKELNSYQEHVDFLCDWIDKRWQWMKTEIESRVEMLNS